MDDVRRLFIHRGALISDVIRLINQVGEGFVLLVEDEDILVTTLTDGDVRRALLAGATLDSPITELLVKGKAFDRPPITALSNTPVHQMIGTMTEHQLNHLPITDDAGRVQSVVLLRDLIAPVDTPITAMVMAGGFGSRLQPLTKETPKPLLPLGDRPMMERVIEQLSAAGITDVNLALHYKPERFSEHFGDGSKWGLSLSYVTEDEPLGTAGALRLLDKASGPVLVVNGDVLSKINFRALLAFHQDHDADLTIAVRKYDVQVPFGVVECEGAAVRALEEKPLKSYLVNAGMYLVNPSVIDLIPDAQKFDMTDLASSIIRKGGRVVAFLIHEYWIDIGQLADYELAQSDVESGAFD